MVDRTVKSKDQQNLWRIWLAAWVTLQEGSVALNMCPVQLLHCIVTAVLTGLYNSSVSFWLSRSSTSLYQYIW